MITNSKTAMWSIIHFHKKVNSLIYKNHPMQSIGVLTHEGINLINQEEFDEFYRGLEEAINNAGQTLYIIDLENSLGHF